MGTRYTVPSTTEPLTRAIFSNKSPLINIINSCRNFLLHSLCLIIRFKTLTFQTLMKQYSK